MKEKKEFTTPEMEVDKLDLTPEEMVQPYYQPRPKWQIVAAWIGLAIVIVGLVLYYYHIANGGM